MLKKEGKAFYFCLSRKPGPCGSLLVTATAGLEGPKPVTEQTVNIQAKPLIQGKPGTNQSFAVAAARLRPPNTPKGGTKGWPT